MRDVAPSMGKRKEKRDRARQIERERGKERNNYEIERETNISKAISRKRDERKSRGASRQKREMVI